MVRASDIRAGDRVLVCFIGDAPAFRERQLQSRGLPGHDCDRSRPGRGVHILAELTRQAADGRGLDQVGPPGPIEPEQREEIFAKLTRAYTPLAEATHAIDAISVLRQDDSGALFRVLERFRLSGE